MSALPTLATVDIKEDVAVFRVRLPQVGAITALTQLMSVSVNGLAFWMFAAPEEKGNAEQPLAESPTDAGTRKERLELPKNGTADTSAVTEKDGRAGTPAQLELVRRSRVDQLKRGDLRSMKREDITLMGITVRASGAMEVATLPLGESGPVVNGYLQPCDDHGRREKTSSIMYADVGAAITDKIVVVQREDMAMFVRRTFPSARRVVHVGGIPTWSSRKYERCKFHATKPDYACASYIVQCMNEALGRSVKRI